MCVSVNVSESSRQEGVMEAKSCRLTPKEMKRPRPSAHIENKGEEILLSVATIMTFVLFASKGTTKTKAKCYKAGGLPALCVGTVH